MAINKINKHAQIGTTLTWFTAFIIIFFIIIIFLSATIVSSGRKYVSGYDTITLQEYSGNLEMQKNLFNVLNSRIEFDEKSLQIKDILRNIDMYNLGDDKKNELKTKLKKQTEDILKDSLGADCYVFQAVYGIENPEETLKKVSGMQGSNYVSGFIEKSSLEFSSSPEGGSYSGYSEKQKQKLFESASGIMLLRETTMNAFGVDTKENQMIRIKFYSGKCL
ncbi:MAG: hypothetical protein AABX54_03630 [Nanoarchaeota archaeon]